VRGYEIHHGRTHLTESAAPALVFDDGRTDGAVNDARTVLGTMAHGIFEAPNLRGALLDALRRRRGIEGPSSGGPAIDRDAVYDRIADHVERHLNVPHIRAIAGERR
jgi:adenosylcobyric acid synthase